MQRFAILFIAAALGAWIAYSKGRNVLLWSILGFLFPPAVLIVALLPRRRRPHEIKACGSCGRAIPSETYTCPYCAAKQSIEMVECPRCGRFVTGSSHCENCGASLHH